LLSAFPIAFAAYAAEGNVQPVDGLKPMSFLAGHCWKGDFPNAKQNDEHCFQWLYGGKALRDTHTVRAPGRPDYIGETTYYWDSGSKRVEYLYVFPATQYVADGQSMTYRVRWTLINDSSYEAWSEMQAKDAWVTMFKLTMKRSS